MKYYLYLSALIGGSATLAFAGTTTHAQQVQVPIEFHRQEHTLSCEVATLKMALKTHGIDVSEAELITQLPFEPTPKQPGIWGDPNDGFVGSIDGRMLVSGYGVYWDPIARLGTHYAHTTVLQHGSAEQLAGHIAAGNPVIIWGYYGNRAVHSWHTPDGTPIKAVNGEHTRVVYGFDGPPSAPTRFYLMDPLSGKITWSTKELMHNWSALHHMGVVVAAQPRWVRVPGDTRIWEISRDRTTRHWVTTWNVFIRQGGSTAAVKTIDTASLLTYKSGLPIQ